MNVQETPNQIANGSEAVSVFGNQATGFSSNFGRHISNVFGTFPNRNNQEKTTDNNSAAFGSSQNTSFGNNFSLNQGFFQQPYFGFGCTMTKQTTNICFTGFGEPKTNYCFTSSFNATIKKFTLVFEHPDIIFGSSIFRKPDTIVEIEAHPINNRCWTTNSNDFSLSVGHIEKYNSIFIVKSATPIKFLVKVKQSGSMFNNSPSSSMNCASRKITLTFQSDQPQFTSNSFKQLETIVEIPLPYMKYDLVNTFSNEDFVFSVGPNNASNSFEVQTSKNSVFKITFAETGKYNNNQLFGNQQSRTGSVFFDQGRQMNAFPKTSGLLFGQAPSAFGTNVSFGSSTSGNNDSPCNQVQPNKRVNATSDFGTSKLFGSSSIGSAIDKRSTLNAVPNTEGMLFGQPNKCTNSQQGTGGENNGSSVFGQLFGNSNVASGFGANQSLTRNPTTLTNEELPASVPYQPTFVSDVLESQSGPVRARTNCITAMSEYGNTSFEELRHQNYLRSSCKPSKPANMPTNSGSTEEVINSNANTSGSYNQSQSIIANTNQAFFDQLHLLIPYLNAGSFCKCIRSCNAAKNQNNVSALTNSQPKANSDSLDHLYVNTQKPRLNDNITINEFYEDVFKYLEYIQKQYRHLESTLNNKNANNIPEVHSNNLSTSESEESNKTSNQSPQKPPTPVFGNLNYSAVNNSLNESSSPTNSGSQNCTTATEKASEISDSSNPKKDLLFGTDVSRCSNHIFSRNSDAAAKQKKLKESSKNENSNRYILKAKSSNKNSNDNTQKCPMRIFGSSTYSALNANLNETVPNIFNSSAVSAAGSTVSSSNSTGNSVSFGAGVNNKIALGNFKGFSGWAQSGKSDDADKMKKSNKSLNDHSSDIESSTTEEKTTGIFSSTAPAFSVNDSSSSEAVGKKSTEFTSFIFPNRQSHNTFDGPSFSTKTNTPLNTVVVQSTSSIFSSTIPSAFADKTFTAPVCSTKDTSSSSAFGEKSTGIFSLNFTSRKYDNTLTGAICSTKTPTSSSLVEEKSTSIFSLPSAPSSCSSSSTSTVKNNSIGLFSWPFPSKLPDNALTAPIFSAKDIGLSSSSLGAKSTGLFSFNTPSKIPDNIAQNESNSSNISNSSVAESKANYSSAKGNFLNVSDNEGSIGGGLLKSFISNGNKSQSGSFQQKNESNLEIDEQIEGGCPSQPFHMHKISHILADINEIEETGKDSSRSDTESNTSSYSMLSNQSSSEDVKTNASSTQTEEEHPTGIVMKRYGYYILPSLEDLKNQFTEHGNCVVKNFTIGRKGYGSVCFNKEINVAGLNVDDIVHFRNKELITFPNSDIQPQIVADLKNCDVLVTLEQVWPHDEFKHEPIKDPQQLDEIKYEYKLRLVCQKNGVHFVDYRPETGCWVFKMKQFTKTNINCWDVEDEANVQYNSPMGIKKIIKHNQPDIRTTEEQEPPERTFVFCRK